MQSNEKQFCKTIKLNSMATCVHNNTERRRKGDSNPQICADEMVLAIQEGFSQVAKAMAPNQCDHDNIIRLQSSVDGLCLEIRAGRQEQEVRQDEGLKISRDLEVRLRTLETNFETQKGLSDRVRAVELGGAKLSGNTAVLVFIFPIAITLTGILITILRHP